LAARAKVGSTVRAVEGSMASRNRPDLAIKRTHDGVDPTAPGVTRKTAIEPLPDESRPDVLDSQ
jgi:hypothetical protein